MNLIVAVDTAGGIAKNGKVPWNSANGDFEFFKEKTKNCVLIGGKNTWKEILEKNPQGLYGRDCLIVSKTWAGEVSQGLKMEGTSTRSFDSFDECVKYAMTLNKKIFIIGGCQIYEEALHHPLLRKIYVSQIFSPSKEGYDCDMFFDERDLQKLGFYNKEESGGITLTIYERRYEETQYLKVMEKLLKLNVHKNRTDIQTSSMFNVNCEYSLTDAKNRRIIPLFTTKRVPFKTISDELLWFLRGEPNIDYLKERNIHIWDGNTSREFLDKTGKSDYAEGETGPIYGVQWRKWMVQRNTSNPDVQEIKIIDQISNVIESLKQDPFSRRHVVSAWNVGDLVKMCLPPCHMIFVFNVQPPASAGGKDHPEEGEGEKNLLNCHLTMRSNDMFLGHPFNVAQYSLLTHMIAHLTGLQANKFAVSIVDCHLYENHREVAVKQLRRKPYGFPELKFSPEVERYTSIDDFKEGDFHLVNYFCHPGLKGDMAV